MSASLRLDFDFSVKPRPVKPPRYPYMVEAKYNKILVNLADEVKTVSLAQIKIYAPDIINQADIAYLRKDSALTTIRVDAAAFGWAALLAEMIERIVLGVAAGILAAANRITEISADLNDAHRREWTRQVDQAYNNPNIRGRRGSVPSINPLKDRRLRPENPFAVNILNREPNLASVISAWEQDNLSLIKSIPANTVEQLRSAFSNAFVNGTTLKELSQIVIDRTDVSKSRATLIARDQIGKLNGKLSEMRQKAAGVNSYVWRTVGDERVRPKHRIRNGKTFNWSDKDIKPGEEIRCRCVADPVFPDLE